MGIKRITKSSGFTIVELLIVIVVIAILAAITIIAFTGVQDRARDSTRLSDMRAISSALKIYAETNGTFPATQATPGAWGWEVSTSASGPTDFIRALRTSGVVNKVPTEPSSNPIRVSTGGQPLTPSRSSENFNYFYFVYAAGSNGCPANRGAYYVLGVNRMNSTPIGQTHPDSPGFSCANRSWEIDGAWVSGGFVN